MFSHIQIGARDLTTLIAFYDAVLMALGLTRLPDANDGGPAGAGWHRSGHSWPQFYVQLPFNGLPATSGNGVQVSFAASSQEQVRAAWEAAMVSGGQDEGAPGLRPQYAADYFGAYCRDPEGNKLCFVHAEGLK
ncbi:lactoylglutathione lyase [Pseudomonas endophytica]|uniref:Lactoylglutathione lyase n=1 Tax=Pseudomonas endophytica TaxID=1563157 RepID=A0A0Q0YV82_9PSED|nr:VOC family protein [Pseudomonas endophytica]KQB53137.1 lactoylglutathione lyase [Pseudomonas endophytica]